MLLSLDPSITCTGWAILDFDGNTHSFGSFKPRVATSVDDRIESICDQLGKLFMETSPEEIVIEVGSL